MARELECKHLFHNKCIKEYMKKVFILKISFFIVNLFLISFVSFFKGRCSKLSFMQTKYFRRRIYVSSIWRSVNDPQPKSAKLWNLIKIWHLQILFYIYSQCFIISKKKNAEMKCGPVHNSIIRNCKFFWSLCSKKYRSKLSRLNFMGLKFIILHVWTSRDWHIKSPRHYYVRQCRLLFE